MLHCCYGSHLREGGHGFFSVESGDDAASAILSHPRTHGVLDQASSKRPRPQGNSSSEARKKHRCHSSASAIASCAQNGQETVQQAVKGIVNHRGGTADNATEYKIRFAKPHDDKRLDEWWPQNKVDVQHIRVYVARKARKAGTH